MRNRANLPRELHGRAFLTTDAAATGPGADRLRAPDVQRPSRGVRSVGLDLMDIQDRCLATLPRMTPGQGFSHSTAAQLYRIPLPPGLAGRERIHVSVNSERQPPRVNGLVGHGLTGIDARMRIYGGFPVTDPVSTWLLLGSTLCVYDLVAAADFLLSGLVTDSGRDDPLVTRAELDAGMRRFVGQRGAKKLRAALDRVHCDVDSRPETWLRLLLIDNGLPEPTVNQPIFDSAGQRLGKPDLAYLWARILFEYEGDQHRVDKDRFRRDISRRETFEAHQWRVIRVSADDVFRNPIEFLARVRRIIDQQLVANPQLSAL